MFVPLLRPVVVRESLSSFWPFQELFLKVDAAKEAAECFAGNGIPAVLPTFPGVRDSLGLESPLCGYGVYKQEKSNSKVETCSLHG